MKTITYTNNQDQQILLRGIQPYLQQRSPHLLLHHDGTQDHPTENGMTRKWAANVKDRFDPLTEEHVLINRYRIPGDPRRRAPSPAESRS